MPLSKLFAASVALSALLGAAAAAPEAVAADAKADAKSIARGKYVVRTSGCNDCHTTGYMESEGKVPEADWLMGSAVGWNGPWGTTYPPNLRLTMAKLTEAQWMAQARMPRRPAMPWFALRDMSDDDLKAIYRYIISLGPKGTPAPAFVPPGTSVAAPYFTIVVPPAAPAAKAAPKAGG